MQDIIKGNAYVLGNNIDTDQIIPAKHLVYSLSDPEESKKYGAYALSGLPDAVAGLPKGNIKFVADGEYRSAYQILIAGKNFGCGSSREHAPAALQIAGVTAVVTQTGDEVEINIPAGTLKNLTRGTSYRLRPLGDVLEIVKAGGLFSYAREAGMLKP